MSFRLPRFGPAQMVMAVALVLLALFIYATVQTAAQGYRLKREEQALTQEVAALARQRNELEGLLRYLKSDEYIEGFARQQFGLVRPGEVAVQVDAPEASGEERLPGQRWWEALFGQ